MAAFSPSCASETTSFTPRRPRRARLAQGSAGVAGGMARRGERAQEVGPERLRLRGADGHAEHLAAAVIVDANGDDDGDRHDASGLVDFQLVAGFDGSRRGLL
jgi:hypothetical protein